MRVIGLLLVGACGIDSVPPGALFPGVDAPPPPGTPVVTVGAPRANASFYVTQTATISWLAEDDSAQLSCDVRASDGSAPPIAIADAVATTPGQATTTTWSLASVPPSTGYRVEVRCDDGALVGTGTSGTFTVAAPPQPVSFASQVLPILTSTCTSSQCHDAVQPQATLELTSGAAYGELVGVASTQCTSTLLVQPGDPATSYLVFKLQGFGSCFVGTKMPKPPEAISADEVQLVRDWIANGAPNN